MTEEPAPPVETTDSTFTDRAFLYQYSENFETPDTWTADAACPVDSPVPYTLTAKAETLLGANGSPTPPLPNGHACAMPARPAEAQPGPSAQPCTYVTEISMPPSDSGIHRLHARMKEPEPEAGQ